MGTSVGHEAPGLGFLIIGLWHLINHIKLYVRNPKSYTSLPWFPTSKIKYLELFFIMGSCIVLISMELFIGPKRHQPLDPDGTIPTNHLHNFEHTNISLTFLIYALFSIILDKLEAPAKHGLVQFLASIAFAQEFLLFHLHTIDHTSVEGQYHWLLEISIFVALVTTLLSISHPKSFINSFVRSFSILFQGVWLTVLGFMLWTPELIPKGCFINFEDGHHVVRCHSDGDLDRAKSLVNIQFSWYLIGTAMFAVTLYLVIIKLYPQKKVEYEALVKVEDQDDVEAQKKSILHGELQFLPIR